jgi:hypothetical protein
MSLPGCDSGQADAIVDQRHAAVTNSSCRRTVTTLRWQSSWALIGSHLEKI